MELQSHVELQSSILDCSFIDASCSTQSLACCKSAHTHSSVLLNVESCCELGPNTMYKHRALLQMATVAGIAGWLHNACCVSNTCCNATEPKLLLTTSYMWYAIYILIMLKSLMACRSAMLHGRPSTGRSSTVSRSPGIASQLHCTCSMISWGNVCRIQRWMPHMCVVWAYPYCYTV